MNLGDLVKAVVPIAAGAYLGPVGGAIASGLGAVATGEKPKDALRYALLSGLGGAGAQKFFPAAAVEEEAARNIVSQVAGSDRGGILNRPMVQQAARKAIEAPEAKTISGELLSSLGYAGTKDDPNLLFKVLNTDLGQGIGAGLLAQLLSGLGEEEDTRSEFEKRPFGAGGPGGQIGGINYMADGGDTYFPRRNGGISPNEGSGTKDDVPAMLMAGEFVMTRDAVEGAGNGDINKGINRMYNMMDNFERMT
jgi:hypothetical protein